MSESVRNQPVLSHEQQLQVTELRNLERDFVALCNRIGKSRELSLAITNMQQAGHWALDHVLGQREE